MAYFSGNVDVQDFPVASATEITEGKFVDIGANGALVVPANGARVLGVALASSANGDTARIPVAVCNGATVEVEAGASLTAGANIQTNAAGEAITQTGNGVIVGKFVGTSNASDGDKVPAVTF